MAEPTAPDAEKFPTMREIGRRSGFTHATVSMALRNSPLISAKTRSKVRQMADRLGYRPDPEIAKLMSHLRLKHKPRFQSVIAALTTIREGEELHYVAALRATAQRTAEALGYGFMLFRIGSIEQRNSELQRILRARGVEGVLLLPMRKAVSLREFLDWKHFTVVAATCAVAEPDFHRIVPDQFGNTLLICQALAQLGHKRIGLIIDARTDLVVEHRFSAAVLWQNALGGTEHVKPLVCTGDYHGDVRAWFARQRPDAIVVGTEEDARSIAKDLQMDLPGRIEFAVTERVGSTPFGGIDQRPEEIGATAVEQLHAKIQSGAKGIPTVPIITMVKGAWVLPSWDRRAAASSARVVSAG